MKNKEKRRFGINVTGLCCIIAALIIPALIIYTNIADSELKSYIRQTLDEVSEHNVSSINNKIASDFLLINQISALIADTDPNDVAFIENLIDLSSQYGFKRMGVIGRNGTAYTSDGVYLDISGEDHIVRSFKGETVISDVFPDSADGKSIFVYSAPIIGESGEVDGVLFATCGTDDFRAHLSESAFGGRGYSYIVKQDGSTVTDSANSGAFKNMVNVFTSMSRSGDNEKVIAQMRGDMAEAGSGCIIFVNTGVSKYMNYAPLHINDWYMLSVVPTDVMDVTRNRIMLTTYIVQTVVLVITVILVAIMIKSEKEKQAKLRRILYVDDLTGGMSFAKFCIDASELIKNNAGSTACVMADLENFRLINNLYGHVEGDKTILHTYRVLKNVIGENDLISRRIADRFYLLIFFRDRAELDSKLESFINELKTSWDDSETEYLLNPSIGVYITEDPAEEIESVTNNATIAHDTISSHTSHIAFYDETQRDILKMNKQLEDRMEHAHRNHEFIPYLQPKYNAISGRICGAEALVRWKNSDGSLTMPGKFIPLAESNGFIRVLDRDMFNAVCRLQKTIIDSGKIAVPISVNVSRQLMYEPNFAQDYIDTIRSYGIDPSLVELEITESVLFDDFEGFRSIIDRLRAGGFKILMDDFGTGYSSLMMLSSVPIDNLKLDKSFIDRFDDEKGRKIINCVIELAKSLNLPLTAEGVETQGQFVFLKSKGCDVIQGYYFSKPIPQEQYIEMLEIAE